jgi:hypothetical protein
MGSVNIQCNLMAAGGFCGQANSSLSDSGINSAVSAFLEEKGDRFIFGVR